MLFLLGKTLPQDNLGSIMLIKKNPLLPILALAAFLAGAALCPAQTAEPAASPAAAGDAKPSASPAGKKTSKKKSEATATEAADKTTEAKTDAKPLAEPAPGGGPGKVWVTTRTKVYHQPDSRYYGRTKDGKYMTEEEAKAMGARPAGTGGKKKADTKKE